MIKINDRAYTKNEIGTIKSSLSGWLGASGIEENSLEGKLVAICVQDPLRLLLLVELIRENRGSMLLIHSDTPGESARATAEEGHCHYLIYQDEIVGLGQGALVASPSLLQFSSGTTGKPKAIIRSWENIDSEIAAYNELLNSAEDETPVILVPPSHSFGLITGILSALKRCAVPHVVTGINPKHFAKIIREYGKPLVYGVPFQFHLLHAIDKELRIHAIVSSGAPLAERLFLDFRNRGTRVMQQYGCTELGCISLAHDPEGTSDNGKWLGYLDVKTSAIKEEPEEIKIMAGSREILTRDLGYISRSGSLHVLNRIDDLINVSGQKVTPFEVEEVLAGIPGVAEAVVYRSKHPLWGDCVGAYIASGKKYEASDIKEHCRKHLASYKVPVRVCFVDEIPRTEKGKISRALLTKLEEKNEQN
jgi:3,4-dihydroxybenzoate---[aryl-carrier protein] ligase